MTEATQHTHTQYAIYEQSTFCLSNHQLSCFHFGVIMNTAAVHIHVQMFVGRYAFCSLRYMTDNELLIDALIFEKLSTFFSKSYSVSHFYQQFITVLISPHPPNTCYFLLKIIIVNAVGGKWYAIAVLICVSLKLMMLSIFSCTYWQFVHLCQTFFTFLSHLI